MQLDSIELYQVTLPLKRPYGPPQYRQTSLSSILARVWVGEQYGWGEVSVPVEPRLSEEWTEGVFFAAQNLLAPLWGGEEFSLPTDMTDKWAKYKGVTSAKYLLECALLDVCSKIDNKPAVEYLYSDTPGGFGATAPKVSDMEPLDVYLSLDQEDDFNTFYSRVEKAVADGFKFFEIKIRPGWDFSMLNAMYSALGDNMFFLAFDGLLPENQTDMLYRFRDFMPILYDQPFSPRNLELTTQMCQSSKLPFGMSYGLTDPDVLKFATELRASDVYGYNPQQIGGWLETKARQAQCKSYKVGTRVWNTLTTPLGQRQLFALAGQENNRMFGFGVEGTQPSRFPVPWFDANDWFEVSLFPADKLEEMDNGLVYRFSETPGWGVEPDLDLLDDFTEQSFEIS